MTITVIIGRLSHFFYGAVGIFGLISLIYNDKLA